MPDTEVSIWSRLIEQRGSVLTPEAARYVLDLDFPESDHLRMGDLGEKARAGTLNDDERQELENYVRVGHVLALMQSKARLSLQRAGFAA